MHQVLHVPVIHDSCSLIARVVNSFQTPAELPQGTLQFLVTTLSYHHISYHMSVLLTCGMSSRVCYST
jgi:hypothetical protein